MSAGECGDGIDRSLSTCGRASTDMRVRCDMLGCALLERGSGNVCRSRFFERGRYARGVFGAARVRGGTVYFAGRMNIKNVRVKVRRKFARVSGLMGCFRLMGRGLMTKEAWV